MILVAGDAFSDHAGEQGFTGRGILASLLLHPTLVSASASLKATPNQNVSGSGDRSPSLKHVYVFQREYATVDPSLIHVVGTDEATTCVGVAIRNRRNGMVSLAHMDFVGVVDIGLAQMLALLVEDEVDPTLDVHVIGGFEDAPSGGAGLDRPDGYSLPLCSKIVEALHCRRERFQIQTLCVLSHNTRRDVDGNAWPIISGFLVDTSSGSVFPASFDRRSRCPDEIVRRIRVTVSSDDPSCQGHLLETYDTRHDRFQIAPCSWVLGWGELAFSLQQLSDDDILSKCSTSPAAEGPDFVENERRIWAYLIKYPDWRKTFSGRRPRIFERTPDGGWLRR